MSTDLGFSLFSGQQIESYILYVKYLEFSFSSGQANGNKKKDMSKDFGFLFSCGQVNCKKYSKDVLI